MDCVKWNWNQSIGKVTHDTHEPSVPVLLWFFDRYCVLSHCNASFSNVMMVVIINNNYVSIAGQINYGLKLKNIDKWK